MRRRRSEVVVANPAGLTSVYISRDAGCLRPNSARWTAAYSTRSVLQSGTESVPLETRSIVRAHCDMRCQHEITTWLF